MRALSLLLFVLLAPLAAGQTTVDPLGRYLVVDMGKKAKFSMDAGDCNPTWTASSDNEGVATVSPAETSGGKRSFTVNTSSMGSATVTVDAVDAGVGCEGNESFEITVIVVKSSKKAVKALKKGLKGATKDFKKSLKGRLKDFDDEFEQIVDDFEAGAAAGFLGDPDPEMLLETALDHLDDAHDSAFETLLDDYQEQVKDLRNAGVFARLNYGFADFLEYLPADFFSGQCGEWDDAARDSWDLFVDTVLDLDELVKDCEEDLAKELEQLGMSLAVSTLASPIEEFTTGGLDGASNIATDFDAGSKPLKLRNPKSTNYTDDEGSSKHGRIRAKGKADPTKGSVTVTYERLDSNDMPIGTDEGDYYQASDVPVGSNCKWKSNSQSGVTPVLCPGTWRVTVSQGAGGNEVTAVKTVQIKLP